MRFNSSQRPMRGSLMDVSGKVLCILKKNTGKGCTFCLLSGLWGLLCDTLCMKRLLPSWNHETEDGTAEKWKKSQFLMFFPLKQVTLSGPTSGFLCEIIKMLLILKNTYILLILFKNSFIKDINRFYNIVNQLYSSEKKKDTNSF